MKSMSRLLDRLLELCGLISGALILFITFGVSYNVIGRKIFQFKRDAEGFGYWVLDMISHVFVPLPWMTEVVEYALFSITFLTAAWVLKHAAHVNVDLLVANLPKGASRVVNFIANALGLIICGILFYYSLIAFTKSYTLNTSEYAELPVKEWWYFWMSPFSAALLSLEFFRRIVRSNRVQAETLEAKTKTG